VHLTDRSRQAKAELPVDTGATLTCVPRALIDSHWLGVTILASLGFAVDPIHRRLVPQTLLAM